MKKFILTLAVALFGFAAQAQEQPTEGAKIQFAEKVINYGKIEKGANGTRTSHESCGSENYAYQTRR